MKLCQLDPPLLPLDPLLPLPSELLPPPLPDSPDGGDRLPPPLGLDGLDGFDGVDVVGHLSVAGIVEPSGHVFVVGGLDGGTDVNGGVDALGEVTKRNRKRKGEGMFQHVL